MLLMMKLAKKQEEDGKTSRIDAMTVEHYAHSSFQMKLNLTHFLINGTNFVKGSSYFSKGLRTVMLFERQTVYI